MEGGTRARELVRSFETMMDEVNAFASEWLVKSVQEAAIPFQELLEELQYEVQVKAKEWVPFPE